MRIIPLGVRGSTAAPGAEFVRYGGHTSCVAVLGDSDEVPRLVLDAGTGLRSLPRLLGGQPFRGHIVLTHLHWDHTQGLPFSAAVDRVDADVRLHVPSGGDDAQELLARSFSPPFFPIGPDGLLGRWQFRSLLPGAVHGIGDLAGTSVVVGPVAHKGGLTLGIRVEREGTSLAYLPDHAWNPETPEPLRASARALALRRRPPAARRPVPRRRSERGARLRPLDDRRRGRVRRPVPGRAPCRHASRPGPDRPGARRADPRVPLHPGRPTVELCPPGRAARRFALRLRALNRCARRSWFSPPPTPA